MSTVAEQIPSQGPYDKRWAWGVRIASLVCIFPSWVMYVVSRINPCGDFPIFWLAISVVWTLIYFIIIFRVGFRGRLSKGGLSWAAKTGLSWSIIAILGVIAGYVSREIVEGLLWAILGLANGALAVSAVKTYRSMEPETHFKKVMFDKLGRYLLCLIFGFLWAVALQSEWQPEQSHARRASAVRGLRSLNIAEEQYASKYSKGFSANLRALGPSSGSAQPDASAAGLIDSSLASGTSALGYTLQLLPWPTRLSRPHRALHHLIPFLLRWRDELFHQ